MTDQLTTASTAATAIPDRAAVAMLTLQIRTAERELAELQAAARAADESDARAQLRSKLEPLENERRQALDAELDRARSVAASEVAAARDRAAEIRGRVAPTAEIVVPMDEAAADAVRDVATDAAAPAWPAPVGQQLVLDADTFARMMSTVIGEAIERTRLDMVQHMPPAQAQPPVQYWTGPDGTLYAHQQMPHSVPAPAKPGFWGHAKHPDVVLLGLATVIVLVILAAWLS